MSERFHQFSGLVDNCEFDRGEKKTTIMDLGGFWEMIYYQVQDVNQKFEALEKQRESNWIHDEDSDNLNGLTIRPTLMARTHRKRSSKSQATLKAKASSGLKALIASKRKKVPNPKDEIPETVVEGGGKTSEDPCSPEKTFDGGFFKIKSPFPQLTQVSPSRITRSAGQTTYLTTMPVILLIFIQDVSEQSGEPRYLRVPRGCLVWSPPSSRSWPGGLSTLGELSYF